MPLILPPKTTFAPMTERQRVYVLALARRFHMPRRMLDGWLVSRYGHDLDALRIDEASEVIDVLAKWDDIPPDIRKASGQRELWP